MENKKKSSVRVNNCNEKETEGWTNELINTFTEMEKVGRKSNLKIRICLEPRGTEKSTTKCSNNHWISNCTYKHKTCKAAFMTWKQWKEYL